MTNKKRSGLEAELKHLNEIVNKDEVLVDSSVHVRRREIRALLKIEEPEPELIAVSFEEVEYYIKTNHFRIIHREEHLDSTTARISQVLQQAHQGNHGTTRWEDVPIIPIGKE